MSLEIQFNIHWRPCDIIFGVIFIHLFILLTIQSKWWKIKPNVTHEKETKYIKKKKYMFHV